MRKAFLFGLLICFSAVGFAQKTAANNGSPIVNEQLKKALVTELQLSETLADRVVAIEEDYYLQVASIKALKESVQKEKAKMREADINRRNKLTAAPLKPRQVEDVMIIVENIRRKQAAK